MTRYCHSRCAILPPVNRSPPHYRQSEVYRRQGVELSRATLGRWSGTVSELLEPLYELLRQYVLMSDKVHTNDIPVPVQEPDGPAVGVCAG